MPKPWYTDARVLDAGDARGLDRPAATDDDLVMPVAEFGAINGDLDAHAARLGIDVATLVRLRARGRGFHRRPPRPLGEILTALTWRFR